jgi:hypothetical protein
VFEPIAPRDDVVEDDADEPAKGIGMSEALPEDPMSIDPARWKRLNMSVAEYKAMRASMLAREAFAPEIGAMAPDFEIKRLSASGGRTGQNFRLSDTRGTPVALIFGSYT